VNLKAKCIMNIIAYEIRNCRRVWYEKFYNFGSNPYGHSNELPGTEYCKHQPGERYVHLANFSDNPSNQSALQNISLQNQTNQSSDLRKDSGDLWSWGKIPIGYEVDKNGTLVKLADQQWNRASER